MAGEYSEVEALLRGRVAVITGAGNGIGRAEAQALAGQGARVVVNDIGTSYTEIGSSKAPGRLYPDVQPLG